MSQNNNATQNANKGEFDKDFQMLSYFQEEFTYRHKHFWSVAVKTFLASLATTTIPIVSESFGLIFNDIIKDFLIVFPLLGIVLAFISYLVLSDEAEKIEAVNIAKYKLNKKMDERYHYYFYTKLSGTEFRDKKTNKKKMPLAKILVMVLLALELIVAFVVVSMLLLDLFSLSS